MDVTVNRFFDRPDARLYLLDNFVTEEECSALKARAEPFLARAAVTGESPGEKICTLYDQEGRHVIIVGYGVYSRL